MQPVVRVLFVVGLRKGTGANGSCFPGCVRTVFFPAEVEVAVAAATAAVHQERPLQVRLFILLQTLWPFLISRVNQLNAQCFKKFHNI